MDNRNKLNDKISEWIGLLREEFSCENKEVGLNWWDVTILAIFGYLKEIIEAIVCTFSNTTLSKISNNFPFNVDIFWTLILKTVIGILLFIYFGFKLRNPQSSYNLWYVIIFLSWCIFRPAIEITNLGIITHIIPIFLIAFQLWFFFAKDGNNMDSLKIMFYEQHDLYVNGLNGRIYKNPWSKISKRKVFNIIKIILIAFAVILNINMFINLMIDLFSKKPESGSTTTIPKNQKAIKEQFKINWSLVSLSALIKAPILEELIFRKCLMGLGKNKLWISFLSGFLFALMHLHNESIGKILPYLISGTCLSLIVYLTKNIWFSIFTHALWNAFGIIYLIIDLIKG